MPDSRQRDLDARLDALLLEFIQRFHEEGPAVFSAHRLMDGECDWIAGNERRDANAVLLTAGAGDQQNR